MLGGPILPRGTPPCDVGAALLATVVTVAFGSLASGQELPPVAVEGQPLAANVRRLLQALDFLGAPMPADSVTSLKAACDERDAAKIQRLLDPHVLLAVHINPEARVKVSRGPAKASLQQMGYTPVLVKVTNDSTATKPLRIGSPQAGPPYAGAWDRARGMKPDQILVPGDPKSRPDKERFLNLEMFTSQPMTPNLSGLRVEYAIALAYSSEAGKREATIAFDIGQGTQDLGFRAETPIMFDVRPAIPVKLSILDHDGKPTVARLRFRDKADHVYPPQARRLAPDLFFQEQIYRKDGDTVLLPPGELTMQYGRGPEYRLQNRTVFVTAPGEGELPVKLERWIDPAVYGFYSGDHHVHAAGCSHYTSPTEGVMPHDMYLQVKGEGLNVGCLLTWGPCYDFQRQFFEPKPNKLSEPFTVLKYDVEVSGFGSQALGHVCLLNLRDQTYPGSGGTKEKGWPTWTTPLMRWAKSQGAITGYAHSANGLQVDPVAAAKRMMTELDKNGDGMLNETEAKAGLLPDTFGRIDTNKDGLLSLEELTAAHQAALGRLPNLAIPELNGIGAQEIFVTTSLGLCDFISAMDTARIPEWNCWYHLMNCGFPLKVSGETDFPCISGSRVGQGRVYVQLGKVERVEFADWAIGLAKGRSYISDGYAHALEFTVDGKSAGQTVDLPKAGAVTVTAKVAGVRSRDAARHVGRGAKSDLEARRSRAGASCRPGRQRRGRRQRGSAGRRQGPRSPLQDGDRAIELGRAAALPADAHEPGDGPRRRPADPGVEGERPVVCRVHRAIVARPGKSHPCRRARGGSCGVLEGNRRLPQDRRGVAGAEVGAKPRDKRFFTSRSLGSAMSSFSCLAVDALDISIPGNAM